MLFFVPLHGMEKKDEKSLVVIENDLSFLAKKDLSLEGIRELTIANCSDDALFQIFSLEKLEHIRKVYMYSCRDFSEDTFALLVRQPRLRSITLDSCDSLTNNMLLKFERLQGLKRITAVGCGGVDADRLIEDVKESLSDAEKFPRLLYIKVDSKIALMHCSQGQRKQ